jgi:hypothetical protein
MNLRELSMSSHEIEKNCGGASESPSPFGEGQRRRRGEGFLSALLVLCALTGCGSLDTADQVHDLRMLAMRAEPPEQIFDVPPQLLASLLDGGNFGSDSPGTTGGTSGSSGISPLPSFQPVTVTGLIADPDGGGRSVHYQFATCARVSDDDARCHTDDPTFQVLNEGDVVPQQASAEVSTSFNPDLNLLLSAIEIDPYHGFGYLPVPVQLTISAGNEQVVGFKRVLYTGALDPSNPPVANLNPIIPTVDVDNHLWAESEVVLLNQRAGYEVEPYLPANLEVQYTKPTFDGTTLTFTESWRYNYFATAGTFSDSETGGTDVFTETQDNINSVWTPRATDGQQDVTFWIVVRDGRGGENWTVRHGHFQPP